MHHFLNLGGRKPSFLIFALILLSGIPALAEGKPKYGPSATALTQAHEYLESHPSALFWKMIPYYSSQETEGSCSVASAVMDINAARVGTNLNADQPLVTHSNLLEKAGKPEWKKAVGPMGRGVDLDQLADYLSAGLKAYKIEGAQVKAIHVDNESAETLQNLHQVLSDSNRQGHTFVIANFVQGTYTGDADVGHLSPIGAYQTEKQLALVLDSDRKWYEPYWVSLKTLVKGMNTGDKQSGKHRGYLVIKVPERR